MLKLIQRVIFPEIVLHSEKHFSVDRVLQLCKYGVSCLPRTPSTSFL